MKRISIFLLLIFTCTTFSIAQFVSPTARVNTPRASKKASVVEYIGISKITIDYFKPGVKGREGKVWGGVVAYNGGKPFPWRAGADENTKIHFEQDVIIEGQPLKAGTYGFHIIPSATEWTLIFSKNYTSWGSFSYDEKEDALRVNIKPQTSEHVEWLRYQFIDQTDNSATIELAWEKMKGSFKVEMNVHAITMQNIRNELRNIKGFSWQAWNSAANYCLTNEKDLEQGLKWANRSISGGFTSVPTFTNYQTKGKILKKLMRPEEAKVAIEKSIELANMTELHSYGRGLIQQGKNQDALDIFQLNRKRNPEDKFMTLVGLARGNEAVGNKVEAIKYYRSAAENAPARQKSIIEGLAKALEEKRS